MKMKAAFASGALAGLLLVGGSVAAQAQVSAAGVVVTAVAAGGPADKAGVARGDIIWSVDGKDVSAAREVVDAVSGRRAGDSVALKISHGDLTRTVQVTLDERDGRPYMGVMLASPVAEGDGGRVPDSVRLPQFAALITEVAPASPAAQAGLRPRDVVVSVNGRALEAGRSLSDAIAELKVGDTATLSVASLGGQTREVQVTLAGNPDKADAAYLGVRYVIVPSFDGSQGPRMQRPWPRDRRAPTAS